MKKPKIVVGTNALGYAVRRNFAEVGVEGYEYARVRNKNELINQARKKITGKHSMFLENTFAPLSEANVSFFHFFNAISIGKKPWISTFETGLPRYGDVGVERRKKGIDAMYRENCKRLIAMSENALNIQKKKWDEWGIGTWDEIKDKFIIMHPPQKLMIKSMDEKPQNEKVHFVFVGNAFFVKGGAEMVEAFYRLYESNIREWKLTIVSAFEHGDLVTRSTKDDVSKVMNKIMRMGDNVTVLKNISNDEVIQLFKQADVSLFPSWNDTYGYVVLESQAAGCPVITTNVRALPEINNNDCGWVIDVRPNDIGMIYSTIERGRREIQKNSDFIVEQLVDQIMIILNHPTSILEKGKKGLTRISQVHNTNVFAERLGTIYKKIN